MSPLHDAFVPSLGRQYRHLRLGSLSLKADHLGRRRQYASWRALFGDRSSPRTSEGWVDMKRSLRCDSYHRALTQDSVPAHLRVTRPTSNVGNLERDDALSKPCRQSSRPFDGCRRCFADLLARTDMRVESSERRTTRELQGYPGSDSPAFPICEFEPARRDAGSGSDSTAHRHRPRPSDAEENAAQCASHARKMLCLSRYLAAGDSVAPHALPRREASGRIRVTSPRACERGPAITR